ncbi:MAG: aspartate 1-decarboxylase [Clostridiales bacterium]|nr:aspartate 1-decarboxylase [Clostridiales bacterium]
MYITMLKSKLHRAVVTDADLGYVGSITIDEALMEAADIVPHEKVQVVNNNNGARFETYVIKGERGSGTICVNGAAARLVQRGDVVIILAYCSVERERAGDVKPTVVLLEENNRIMKQNKTTEE